MRSHNLKFVLFIGYLLCFGLAQAEEISGPPQLSDAPVVYASLFKNGLVLIGRELTVPADATSLLIDGDPRPIHGTFWLNFDTAVRLGSTELVWKETVKTSQSRLDIKHAANQLGQKRVQLVLRDGEKVSGILQAPEGLEIDFFLLKTDKGVEMIDLAQVTRVICEDKSFTMQALSKSESVEHKKMVFKLHFSPSGTKRTLSFSYLCRGASWAPAYRLDLQGVDKGFLSFQGAIKNEVAPFKQTQVTLVSGFPAILYEWALSPLALGQSLEDFLRSLNPGADGHGGVQRNYASAQTQIMSNMRMDGPDIANPGVAMQDFDSDIHVRKVGPIDLGRGEALMLDLGKGETKFERVIEWTIPESRDRDGRYQQEWRQPQPGASPDELWDTLLVENPFDFPMTTAPFAVYQNGQILSQNTSYWTAKGQKSRVRSGKALNISTDVREQEIEENRKRIEIDKDDYQQTDIRCDILISNLRKEPQTLIIKRTVWGKIMSTVGSAQKRQLAEGAQSQNPRSEIEWRITVKSGEKAKIGFIYQVLTNI